jgi:hypothetical protein
MTLVCPGLTIWITPPHMHINLELLSSAGMLAIKTVGTPGTHGATVAGTHGMGVRTPSAAAVAAATVGFDGDEHMPNGMMFTNGLLSMMLASGVIVIVRFCGSTTRLLGAAPKLHCSIAPIQTCIAMIFVISVLSSSNYLRAGGVGGGA